MFVKYFGRVVANRGVSYISTDDPRNVATEAGFGNVPKVAINMGSRPSGIRID